MAMKMNPRTPMRGLRAPMRGSPINPPRYITLRSSSSDASVPAPAPEPAPSSSGQSPPPTGFRAWLEAQKAKTADIRKNLGALGLSAILAYGLFDALTYTTAFCIAFITYEAQTGINPTTNVKAVISIMVLMWAGNNATRPFRVGGAALVAPYISKFLKAMQERFKLPSEFVAFALVVGAVATVCLSIVGSLFLSRMVGR